ncbi:hypothetical protein QZH41_018753 [Actinostola sp. cb2023]|nr:hypothetical protein QZH41_018753 [Actinostola sp. cb2023]
MVGFCQDEAGQAKWEPTKISSICSKHFLPDDFQRKYLRIEGQEKAWIPRLIRDDFGIAIFPRIHAEKVCKETEDKPSTSRDRRKISYRLGYLYLRYLIYCHKIIDYEGHYESYCEYDREYMYVKSQGQWCGSSS